MTDLSGLIGRTEPQLTSLLGPPKSRRETGADVWCVFAPADLECRVRFRDADGGRRCASWTASFADGFRTLADATSAVGLWPAASPDESAESVHAPLVRRAIRGPEDRLVYSLTATVRNGRFAQISVFDEAPDWR
ncbi:MAG: hypothetical protein OEM23_03315 [Gemmatimonadota bacterium]|nr:hypothetical protein [Gemmatimonadota bacterium]MDH3427442.1 hypothetical protein [Gemmatimonadota bacterium]